MLVGFTSDDRVAGVVSQFGNIDVLVTYNTFATTFFLNERDVLNRV